MTTAFLLFALVIVIGFTTLVGGALFFVGLVKKNGTVRRAGTILFVSSLFGLAGCFKRFGNGSEGAIPFIRSGVCSRAG